MGRLKKYDVSSSRLAEELDAAISLARELREQLQGSNEVPDAMAVKRLSEILNNTVKTKLAYDKANKAEAESLTPAQEQATIIGWICDMTKATRDRFMARLAGALDGTPVDEDEE